MSAVPIVAFVTQMALLLYYSKDDYTDYSEQSLFYTVLIYTFLLEVFFMLISVSWAAKLAIYLEKVKVSQIKFVPLHPDNCN
jgi:hypothetical protein